MINIILYFLRKRKSYYLKKYEEYNNLLHNQHIFAHLLDAQTRLDNEMLYSSLIEKYKNKCVYLSDKISVLERKLL